MTLFATTLLRPVEPDRPRFNMSRVLSAVALAKATYLFQDADFASVMGEPSAVVTSDVRYWKRDELVALTETERLALLEREARSPGSS